MTTIEQENSQLKVKLIELEDKFKILQKDYGLLRYNLGSVLGISSWGKAENATLESLEIVEEVRQRIEDGTSQIKEKQEHRRLLQKWGTTPHPTTMDHHLKSMVKVTCELAPDYGKTPRYFEPGDHQLSVYFSNSTNRESYVCLWVNGENDGKPYTREEHDKLCK